ncbi:MAG: 50S ribosomal protein L3 [Candidatus Wildermuthbacteria bacterium]|nr:50S ribosomal protein L3 [Candidatus Wildermuthbacteria bacterium]
MKAILGKKVGMTQIFKEDKVIPVTVIEAGPVQILSIKTKAKHGYDSAQFGYGEKKKTKKPRFTREFKNIENAEAGQTISVSEFSAGTKVRISGISKGKGFQGAVKRHGFSGRNASHGVKHEQRTIGSTGMRFPQHVIKGRKMAGRMGSDRITVKNLEIVAVDAERNLLSVKGAVPGSPGTLLEIRTMK